MIKDLGRGRVQLGDSTGKLLKKSYNVNRLRLWVEPNKIKVMEKARTDVLPKESVAPEKNVCKLNLYLL